MDQTFIADPLQYMQTHGKATPQAWVQESWKKSSMREMALYYLFYSLSKGGDFAMSEGLIAALGASLSAEKLGELYLNLREKSDRPEAEWREAFVCYCPLAPLPTTTHQAEHAFIEHVLFISQQWEQQLFYLTQVLQAPLALDWKNADGHSIRNLKQHIPSHIFIALETYTNEKH